MSNFQRTRSKVWWDDSPGNIGSPVAQSSGEGLRQQRADEQDWAPQLPHWVAQEPIVPPQNAAAMASPPAARAPWPQRQGSPGSHKSQDSGFSDSDNSPPPSQYYPSPNNNARSPSIPIAENVEETKEQNNNDVSQPNIANLNGDNDERSSRSIDAPVANSPTVASQRFRSTSVIQTPYDLQNYIDIHSDSETHKELLRDKSNEENLAIQDVQYKNENSKNTLTPNNNMNKNESLDKCSPKKKFHETHCGKKKDEQIKVARILPVDTKMSRIRVNESSKNDDDSIEYIQSNDQQFAVNNLPRIRSPITRISCQRSDEETRKRDIEDDNTRGSSYRHFVRRSMSAEDADDNICHAQSFRRNRLNKSMNHTAYTSDKQFLDMNEAHSLGYKEDDVDIQAYHNTVVERQRTPATRTITDSLNLKTPKRPGPKARQKVSSKAEKVKSAKCAFRIFSPRKEIPEPVDEYAGGILEGSRVPALGLPRSQEEDQWVVVGHPEREKLVHCYKERLIISPSDAHLAALASEKEQKETPSKTRRITPPSQFQDSSPLIQGKCTALSGIGARSSHTKHLSTDSTKSTSTSKKTGGSLTKQHLAKLVGLSGKQEKSLEQRRRTGTGVSSLTDGAYVLEAELEMACASTPKMLAPHEYMANAAATPHARASSGVRRVNLLNNFNESIDLRTDGAVYRERIVDYTKLEKMCLQQPEPVQHWLCDVIGLCEDECMTTLQSKALGSESKAALAVSSATITGNIKKVQTHGQIIVYQYSEVVEILQTSTECTVHGEEQICWLVANINEFVLAHSITLNTKPPGETPERWDKIKRSLQGYLHRLMEISEDVKLELNETCPKLDVLQKHLDSLLGIFIETTKAVLIQQLKTLVSIIEEPPSDMILKSTLTSISHLGTWVTPSAESNKGRGKTLCLLRDIGDLPFAECEVPRALLAALIETNKSSVKALCLRALAIICITGEAVKQFEESGGWEIISDVLGDVRNPEPQVREAVTALTQVTAAAPGLWLRLPARDTHSFHNTHLKHIVRNLTDILSRTKCCQLLLLCTACLNNLLRLAESKSECGSQNYGKDDIIEILIKNNTLERLLEAVKIRGPNISVFLQEQTSSLLNTLSSIPRSWRHVSSVSVVSVALVCFASAALAPVSASSERTTASYASAYTRMLRNTVEAIFRFSSLPDMATQFVQLEGVPRLIRLIKSQRTNSGRTDQGSSDQILVHCLKALRSLHRHHDEAFIGYEKEVNEMITPHLVESIVIFSTKQESYV